MQNTEAENLLDTCCMKCGMKDTSKYSGAC